MEPTASSVRSYLAPPSGGGSPPAFGVQAVSAVNALAAVVGVVDIVAICGGEPTDPRLHVRSRLANPRFLAILEESRASYEREGGISSEEVKQMFEGGKDGYHKR